mmetsp:Transcript_15115/g.24565  ORF Transcript_15115/g.24565 Transcript_15115/m.24565 type:complete len:87 (-) Transcript_15115:2057-2317(-)
MGPQRMALNAVVVLIIAGIGLLSCFCFDSMASMDLDNFCSSGSQLCREPSKVLFKVSNVGVGILSDVTGAAFGLADIVEHDLSFWS